MHSLEKAGGWLPVWTVRLNKQYNVIVTDTALGNIFCGTYMETVLANWIFPLDSKTFAYVCIDRNDPSIEQFYQAYDQCFVLENEKETLEGFKACLQQNVSPVYEKLRELYGDYRECIMLVRDSDCSQSLIGGANWICFSGLNGKVSINLNYIFVLPSYRGQGYFKKMITACERISAQFAVKEFASEKFVDEQLQVTGTLLFTEQNHPGRMSIQDQRLDSHYTGMDQIDRLRIWETVGSKIIDFPYVQPPLSMVQKPMDTLLYTVRGIEEDQLDPLVLKYHLERFFGISVLKGKPLFENQTAKRQLEYLEEMALAGEKITLVSLSAWIQRYMEANECNPT